MADIDIDPFGEHESRTEEPTDEHIPLDPVTPVGGGSTWKPTCEQETSFGGRESQRTKLTKDYVKDKKMLKILKRYQKTLVKPQKNFTMITSNSKMESCTTETRESP